MGQPAAYPLRCQWRSQLKIAPAWMSDKSDIGFGAAGATGGPNVAPRLDAANVGLATNLRSRWKAFVVQKRPGGRRVAALRDCASSRVSVGAIRLQTRVPANRCA